MMNKCSVNKRMVASILLFSHIGMSCSNHYNPGVDQNRLGDQPTTTFSNSISNSSNSKGQISTLALVSEEEEAGQMISPEVDDKKPDYQASGPVHANLTLDGENSSRIEKLGDSKLILLRNINNNNRQSRKQEIAPFFSLNREVKDASNSISPRPQASISKGESGLQVEADQEGAIDTQLLEAVQIDLMEVQQANNQTLSIEPLQTLIDLQEEANEETSTDTDLDERAQQANKILDFQREKRSLICCGTVLGFSTVLSFIGLGFTSFFTNSLIKDGSSTDSIIVLIAVILMSFFSGIATILVFKEAYVLGRMLRNATYDPFQ